MPAPGRNFCRRDGIEGFSFFQEAYSAGFQQGYQWLQEHTKEFIIRRKNEHYRSKDEPDQKLLRLTDAFAEEGGARRIMYHVQRNNMIDSSGKN